VKSFADIKAKKVPLKISTGKLDGDNVHPFLHSIFGPRMFVRFPERDAIFHGATAEQDAVVLFIRHDPRLTAR
jgi:hypothetical protein